MTQARIAAAALGLAVAGCGPRPAETADAPMEYRYALRSEVNGLDPATSNGTTAALVQGAIFEGLTQYHYLDRPYRVIPALADGMPRVSEDGRAYTFKIKRGVRFHDDPCFGGAPRLLTARDFIYAWKRLADPANQSPGWWVFDDKVVGLDAWRDAAKAAGGADYAAPVAGLTAPDDHTLVVRLTRPYPQLLYVLALKFTAPVAREAVEKYGPEVLNHPVGTGPFRLAKFVPGSRLVLERFEHFRPETYPTTGSAWARENGMLADAGKRLPFLDRIVYEIVVESQPAWLKFRAGRLDRASIPKDSFDQAMASPSALDPELEAQGVKLQVWPGQIQWWVGMNTADPAFAGEKGRHLRRAIAYAHDAEKFLRVIQNGRGRPADSIIPPTMPAYDPDRPRRRYTFSPEKAAAELAAAGYPGGKGAPKLRFDLRGSGSLSRQIGEFIKREIEAIGLEVELVGNTFPQFLQKANRGQLQVYWGGWVGDYPDEENWLQLLYGGNKTPGPNFANFEHPEYDALYEEVRGMADGPARREKIQRMTDIALTECPWRMSFTGTHYVLHHRWLKNFVYADVIYNHQKYLRVDRADRARGL